MSKISLAKWLARPMIFGRHELEMDALRGSSARSFGRTPAWEVLPATLTRRNTVSHGKSVPFEELLLVVYRISGQCRLELCLYMSLPKIEGMMAAVLAPEHFAPDKF